MQLLSRQTMSRRFVTLLERAARLRQRFEFERQHAHPDPIRLLKLRRLGLIVEAQLKRAAVRVSPPTLTPVRVSKRPMPARRLAAT